VDECQPLPAAASPVHRLNQDVPAHAGGIRPEAPARRARRRRRLPATPAAAASASAAAAAAAAAARYCAARAQPPQGRHPVATNAVSPSRPLPLRRVVEPQARGLHSFPLPLNSSLRYPLAQFKLTLPPI